MSWSRPNVFQNGDTLVTRGATEADYRVPFTFIEALNDGVLFDRPASAFRDAAHAHRLFEIVNQRTEALVGTCIVQKTPRVQGERFEVGGMMIHPTARHFGLNTLLTKAVMFRELDKMNQGDTTSEFIAHVIDGNQSPVDSLLECGFRPLGRVIINGSDVGAGVGHMEGKKGAGVVMNSYVFDIASLGRIAKDLYSFQHQDGAKIHKGEVSVKVDLSGMFRLSDLDSYSM